MHGSSYDLCSPLISTPDKIKTLNLFRNNEAPLIFWHLQKSGGSAYCYMMRKEYRVNKEAINTKSPDCNDAKFSVDIILNFTTWEKMYKPKGYLFVALETSNSDYKTFPIKYHKSPETLILLDKSVGIRHVNAWKQILHVMVIRHPVDMAISAFNYKFQGTEIAISGACLKNNFSDDECMQELFRIKDDPTIITHSFFNPQQLNRIRNEILGDYVIDTLT